MPRASRPGPVNSSSHPKRTRRSRTPVRRLVPLAGTAGHNSATDGLGVQLRRHPGRPTEQRGKLGTREHRGRDVATIHVPGTGVGPHGGKHGRRVAIIAAVLLAFAAIVAPFALRDLGRSGAQASAATHVSAPSPTASARGHSTATDAAVGPRGHLPALLPGHTKLTNGTHVRLGDLTSGVLRRTPDGTWKVLVRWNGRLQPLPTRGPVELVRGSGARGSTTWISNEG